jgi:hypothetical protein
VGKLSVLFDGFVGEVEVGLQGFSAFGAGDQAGFGGKLLANSGKLAYPAKFSGCIILDVVLDKFYGLACCG